jgi:DNA (cytosine-5)-methyltransferase 1
MEMLSFVDLFCGGGFGARGAVRAGGRPILGVDAWKLATDTYMANFPQAAVLQKRIEELDPYALSRRYKPDVLLTSPECTAHSIARGSKPGSEKSRETAINIIPWVDAMKPKWVIVENVNRMKSWDRHDDLIVSLKRLGYQVNDLFLNAADFGTPQSRKRMFLVCDRNGSIISKEDLLAIHKKGRKDARSIIDLNGTYETTLLRIKGRAKATLARAERAIAELGENVPFIIVYYGSDYAGGWQRLDAPLRTVTTLDRFALVTWKKRQPHMRMLQPQELLRAMGTGNQHSLPYGNRREKIKLCGNGVCSPVVEVIFRKIGQLTKDRALLKAS